MASIKLTEETVEAAACPPGKKDVLLFDKELQGFGMRVTSSGGKVFIAQYNVGGVKRRKAIGPFGVLTVKQARSEAKGILGDAARGRDPVAEERAKKAAAVQAEAESAFTVRKLIEDWAVARAEDRRENYVTIARANLLRNLVPWLDRPASGISTVEAVRLLDATKKERGTVTANRVLAYARAAWGWALKRQLVTSNPLRGIERPGRETPRERVLAGPELAAIWTASDKLGTTLAGAVRLMLLTLQRGQEVCAMQWDELDSVANPSTWTIPRERAKNGRAHVVHLSEPARAVLRGMPLIKDNPFVFAGQGRRPAKGSKEVIPQPTKSLNYAKIELATETEKVGVALAPWVFHDFRRSGVTALADMGFAPHVCDRLLNHITGAIQGVAAVYQRAEFLPERKAALDAWASFVVAGGDVAAGDNVVRLARAG